jgi:hypothetical protein
MKRLRLTAGTIAITAVGAAMLRQLHPQAGFTIITTTIDQFYPSWGSFSVRICVTRALKPLLVLAALTGCRGQADDLDALNDLYQNSIATAAIKRPDYIRPLQPIDTSKAAVTVVHIQSYPSIDTSRFTWVTLPDALRDLCRGKPDPLLALQQALGLPPEKRGDIRVFTFDVRPVDMFRPCASSPDITTTQCTVGLVQSAPLADTQTAAEHFVLKQIMDS